MRYLLFVPLLMTFFLCAACHAWTAEPSELSGQKISAEDAEVRELQDKILKDNEVADLIAALQDDPEVRAVLNDAAAMNAVLSGDINYLDSDPRFRKLLGNPRVQDILKRLSQ